MKKFTIAAAMLAATFFSGNAFALTGVAKGIQVPNDAVKVSYCRPHVRHGYIAPHGAPCTCGWSWYWSWPDCQCGTGWYW